MKKIVAQDENDWVTRVNEWLADRQRMYSAESLYVPAGETPKLIYKNWRAQLPEAVSRLNLIQIDDVMTGTRTDLFKDFFREELPAVANTIEYIDTADTQADLGLLGIGMNGHVAFHEPGLPQNFYSGCVRLEPQTLKTLELEPETWGKTYGAGAFLKCRALLIIVKGVKKKEILQKTLSGTNSVPASALLKHPDITILSDFEF